MVLHSVAYLNLVKRALPRRFPLAVSKGNRGLRAVPQCFLALIGLLMFCFTSLPANSREYETGIVDNLSVELGFPVYSWSPSGEVQAVLLAIHGATLHGRSYTKFGRTFANKGYAVFAPDMRGFGGWYQKNLEDDPLSHHVLYRQSESDLKKLLAKLHQLYPGKAIFLVGESVGANMAIKLIAADPECAEGMILSSPAIKQRLFFGPTVMKQVLTVFFVKPGAQLDVTPYLRSRVSEDQQIIDERVNDPLARNKMNVGELFKTRWFNKECLKFLPLVPSKISTLILEGSEDKLFHAQDVENLLSGLPCEDKTLHVLKGRGHINLETAFMNKETERVLESWLNEKCLKFAQQNVKDGTMSSMKTSGGTP